MSAKVGLVLWGGRLDGREVNTARELEQAQAQVATEGRYVLGDTTSPSTGRRVLRWEVRHAAPGS